MPHRAGDPLPCMTQNQIKVVKAYGCIPVWLDMHGNLVCTYCNGGKEGCASSCLQAQTMENLRADVKFLDQEDAKRAVPLTIAEVSSNFHRFCYHPDVAALVDADSLYFDFMERHKIILILQNLCEWLKKQAEKYAGAGGVHNQSRERLWLKCNRALSLFLRLDVDAMTEEDTIILSNIMECACPLEMHDPPLYAAVQKLIDLVSIIGTFKEIRGHQETLEALIVESEPAPVFSDSSMANFPPNSSHGTSQVSSKAFSLQSSDSPRNSPALSVTRPGNQNQNESPPTPTFASPTVSTLTNAEPIPPHSNTVHQSQLMKFKASEIASPNSQSLTGSSSSSGTKRKYDSMAEDSEIITVRRCMGRTQSGARCKLTEESVHRLHGRCAEAAKSLVNGSNYCLFHRAQENNSK